MLKYQSPAGLNLDVYPSFLVSRSDTGTDEEQSSPSKLDPDLAEQWFQYLQNYFPPANRRSTLLFGDPGTVYIVRYRGVESHRPVLPWAELGGLWELKTLVEKITQQKYTVCAIQCYPSGKYGIAAHRDKEMIAGTRISGISLGATRTIEFKKAWGEDTEPVQIKLPPGSLYVMNPPTNQKYTHAILKDYTVKDARISLTFRDY